MELVTIKLDPDDDGYTGRECPACAKYFKIKGGTGLPGSVPCHCPYCNQVGEPSEFATKDQIEYAKSVVLNKVSASLLSSLKKLERRPRPGAFISIGITVKGSATPIIRYSEKELEERITCSSCTLQYAIYGVFGFCPDCGVHNSLQIATANLDLISRMLDLAKSASQDISGKLIENAMEDAVACFDGFGREHCSKLPFNVSFQNIEGARQRLLKETGLDIANALTPAEWSSVCEQFQKRHLLAHKMGIVDAEFINRTAAPPSLLGRKVSISEQDVRTLIRNLGILIDILYRGITRS